MSHQVLLVREQALEHGGRAAERAGFDLGGLESGQADRRRRASSDSAWASGRAIRGGQRANLQADLHAERLFGGLQVAFRFALMRGPAPASVRALRRRAGSENCSARTVRPAAISASAWAAPSHCARARIEALDRSRGGRCVSPYASDRAPRPVRPDRKRPTRACAAMRGEAVAGKSSVASLGSAGGPEGRRTRPRAKGRRLPGRARPGTARRARWSPGGRRRRSRGTAPRPARSPSAAPGNGRRARAAGAPGPRGACRTASSRCAGRPCGSRTAARGEA